MKLPKSKLVWIAGIVAVVLGIAIAIFFATTQSSKPNYAEETAKPIEQALVKAGAVKKCSYGYNGRGTDSQQPWYDAFYELPEGRERALRLINEVAVGNGYQLTHATKDNRGDMGSISDEYIENWYFDNMLTSPYDDLQTGEIKLALGLNNDGEQALSNLACGAKDTVVINSNNATTMISLSVKLPEFKR